MRLSIQRHLRSVERNLLHVYTVLRHRLNTYGRRAIAIARPSAWNSLSNPVRNPNSTEAAFRRLLDIFVGTVRAHPPHRSICLLMRYINRHICIDIPTFKSAVRHRQCADVSTYWIFCNSSLRRFYSVSV